MALFGSKKPKVRRPVAEIVAGFTDMVADLDEARQMAAAEQAEREAEIERLVAERNLLLTEQSRADTVASNIRSLLSMDLDGDGEPDDLSNLIAAWREQKAEAEDDNILGIDVEGDDDAPVGTDDEK